MRARCHTGGGAAGPGCGSGPGTGPGSGSGGSPGEPGCGTGLGGCGVLGGGVGIVISSSWSCGARRGLVVPDVLARRGAGPARGVPQRAGPDIGVPSVRVPPRIGVPQPSKPGRTPAARSQPLCATFDARSSGPA